MESPNRAYKALETSKKVGTLAIDLGNTTTVVAFQGEKEPTPELLDLPPISRLPGEIPSLIWVNQTENPPLLIGQEVIKNGRLDKNDPNLRKDFKSLIGGKSSSSKGESSLLTPEEAGKLFLEQIWLRLPENLEVKRLVITSPVETYRSYREWLLAVFKTFPVNEIALVDEPTAAALGAGLPPGSKLLVVDLGGSTIDISLVAIEGGEGRAAPIAQLLRFNGQDIEGISRQASRSAKVLGKAGLRLGGRDIDKWIANHLFPEAELTETLLNAAERLKCRLSNEFKERKVIAEQSIEENRNGRKILSLCRKDLEELLINKGFLESLSGLLKKVLSGGRSKGCDLQDLDGVIAIGGGSRIPLLKDWLTQQTHPAKLLTPPPIEAVAKGALSLTPGVKVRDVLNRSFSLRCWDKRSESHFWHPLFISGQPWPTTEPLEIVLSASHLDQREIELVVGENEKEGKHEVIYNNGIPRIHLIKGETSVKILPGGTMSLFLNPPGQPGEDCFRLQFKISENSYLQLEGVDLRTGDKVEKRIIGSIK